MRAGSVPPEIPPFGPEIPRPEPTPPPTELRPRLVPDDTTIDARSALLRQRRVMLTGALDETAATRVAAELMMLDGESTRKVELIVNSEGGPLPEVLAIIDVLDLMRAPVATRCIGQALGTAAVVLASGTAGRAAAANALISLRLHEHYDVNGRAVDVERFAGHLAGVRDRIEAHLRAVTGLRDEQIRSALDGGDPLTADAARAHGVIDEIIGA